MRVRRWAEVARGLPDPLARLRYFITSTLESLDGDGNDAATARFVVSTHWRLHRNYPQELADVGKPLVDLLRGEVHAAVDQGLLNPSDPDWDSWFVSELARSVFHFYAFAPRAEGELDLVKERLWRFCLTALGGTAQT